ncbi:MAG: phage gp6-like head-tail connector protein [Pisciglobus halotolerans]|nr:phage gp6-like head-tail connector protein [Pisciglobus halotolerans]
MEDENLNRILKSSESSIKSQCGTFDYTNERAVELVLERARYAYNDSLEFFEMNFREQLLNLSLDLYLEEADEIEKARI